MKNISSIAMVSLAAFLFAGCGSKPVSPEVTALFPYTQEQAKNAQTVLFEDFSDPLCSHCKALHKVLEEVKKELPNVEFKSYTFSFLGVESYQSSLAIECSGLVDLQKRNAMATLIFSANSAVTNENRMAFAAQLGLPTEPFAQCLKDETTKPVITQTLAEGKKRGVNGTPAIFINGERYEGARDKASLVSALQNAKK